MSEVHQRSTVERKIALFHSLFRGREDVYPRRFESRRTGRSGYTPVCVNEWVRDVCERSLRAANRTSKRWTGCANCAHRNFVPVTSQVIERHLTGRDEQGREFVMGVYPLLPDDTCYFLAADFDKSTWRDDVRALIETCRQMALPVAIERSRSGNGAHVWWFFQEALPAALARKLGCAILTETMDRRPDIGLDSYDRFFPSQDTLPRDGFGNLIALPLQKQRRQLGCTVFLDDHLISHPDQWAFLSSIRKLTRDEVETQVRRAETSGRVLGVQRVMPDDDGNEPWTQPPSRRCVDPPLREPLPESLELVVGNDVYIAKTDLPSALRNRLLRLAAFQNPEFYRMQAGRQSTWKIPRIIACAEDHARHISLPRGCLDAMRKLLRDAGIRVRVRDERQHGTPITVSFSGILRPEQKAAADILAKHDDGVLAATTAFGKTVLAAWLIARRGVNTLVLVHRRQLMEQWVERLGHFLELPPKAIGCLGGGRHRLTGTVDVALIQSLSRKGVVRDCVADYGHLIVDECHHLSAPAFEQVTRRAKARYVLGLSATVTRKDGQHPIILMQCGPIRYRVDARQQATARPFRHCVRVRPTAFQAHAETDADARIQFHQLCAALIVNHARNRLIVEDVVDSLREGRSPIVLTERTEHLDILESSLKPRIACLMVLRGGLTRKQLNDRLNELASIPADQPRLLLATGKYIGEGFDDARLDTLFLTMPVSWRGTIAQYAGRLHRQHEDKREVRIYDYADLNVPMLARMFDRRCRGYEALGYTVMSPASATPGWPPDVPLPDGPEWKRDYASSVQRLIRDGVDPPLGNLFVQAAHGIPSDAEGVQRARSDAEAFLFRRLQTLPETAGIFRLNETLPIAFNAQGGMEVDFLCAAGRLVIEVDGAHHLNDPEAYRRDRRKDALLQENGYFVLRFLANDLAGDLDTVLDTILRTLAHRQRGK